MLSAVSFGIRTTTRALFDLTATPLPFGRLISLSFPELLKMLPQHEQNEGGEFHDIGQGFAEQESTQAWKQNLLHERSKSRTASRGRCPGQAARPGRQGRSGTKVARASRRSPGRFKGQISSSEIPPGSSRDSVNVFMAHKFILSFLFVRGPGVSVPL